MESLDDVLKSLFEAVLEAQMLTSEQHLNQLDNYLDQDGKPEIFSIQLPAQDGDEAPRQIDIPALALAPPSSLKIKDISVNFRVNLGGIDRPKRSKKGAQRNLRERASAGRLQAALSGGDAENQATIHVTFDQATTPETYHRVSELMSRTIPWS